MPFFAILPSIASVVVAALNVGLQALENSERDFHESGFKMVVRYPEVPRMEFDPRQSQSCFGPVKEGVPPHIVDSCCNGLAGASVNVFGSIGEGVSIAGLPYDCIPLAPWVDGTGVVPYACGDDCIKYDGLTADEYSQIKAAFEARV